MLDYKRRSLFDCLCVFRLSIWIFFLFISSLFFVDEALSKTLQILDKNQKIDSVDAPKLVLDRNIYDYGVIKPNSTNKAVFNLTNAGNKPLVIKDVEKCCGAVIKLDKEEIAPGESAILTAEYYFSTGTGTFTKTISLKTNEPNNPQTKLTIMGTMIQTLKWEPDSFKIASFGKDGNCPEIKITSLDNTRFSVKKISFTGNCLSADFDPNYTAVELILKPKVNAEKLKELTSNKGSVNIELNHPDYKTITLNFDIIPSLQATPAQILVFNADANEPITKSVELQDNQNNSNISKQIESIVSESGSKVEIVQSTMANKNCKLDLKITPAEKKNSESFLRDQLVIKMNDGRELKVPIRIFYATQILSSKAN